jgi:hypothetical protein
MSKTSRKKTGHRHAVTARLHDLLDTIPVGRGIPTFDDTLNPPNGPHWHALHVALNGGKPFEAVSDKDDPFDAENKRDHLTATREEAAYRLGVAVTLRAVEEAHELIRGLVAGAHHGADSEETSS